ncbi:MAG: hypothetical protein IJ267_08440 [Bacteroidales bacterium]|nr:hypothetical protein [Bacteroidales bacterium]MBQ8035140.1 hypothetical protein [Bacteroidales bacterium]MBR4093807.1 hypothetical protein [Bacteroidales bacterium]
MKKHLIRSVKYFFYIAIFFCILVTIMFYTSTRPEGTTVFDLFKEGAWWKILLFFIAFAGVYPFVGYQKKKIYTAENLKTKKDEIITLFENANFVLESETETTLTFRLRNKFLRFMRTYEDAVVIDYSDIPATISGLRKDTLRFSRSIEYLMRERD